MSHKTDKNDRSKIKNQIDENLKRIYDEITREEVPERFKLLLEQLRQKSGDEPGGSQ